MVHPPSPENVTAQKAIYECWKYDIGCHAYFSCGAARGSEIRRLPDISKSQLLWNSIRFQLRSTKNQSHGKTFNEQVEHWLPPSASRRSIICHHILYPSLEAAGYRIPEDKQINSALSEMFAKTMNLPKCLSAKLNRDFISVLTDYIAPSSLAKTSTSKQMASQFHHSQSIHDMYYSADTFRRDKDGNMIPGPLTVAHQIWSALGETSSTHTDCMRPIAKSMILTKIHYDYAAKRAYNNSSATATDLQYAAIKFAASTEINKHAFVFMGCGTGKSGIYNLLLLGAYLNRAAIPKTMVISPHNSLLSMHKMQACHYLRGTSLMVSSLLPVDIHNKKFPTHFDILFISIHAFNDIMVGFEDIVKQWDIQNIFVDEYHNVVGELFRLSSSWQSLRILASLNAKIMLLSATTDRDLMNYMSNFMSLGKYETIGSINTYPVPNVRIAVMNSMSEHHRESLLEAVVQHCRNLTERKKGYTFKMHAITMSRQDASDLSDKLNKAGMHSMWLTSNLPPAQKSQYLQMWEDGDEKVLVSTFTDGIDNTATEDVIIVGGTYSIYNLVQALGRIRPRRQNFAKASLCIFHSSRYVQFEEQSINDNVSKAVGANIFKPESRDTSKEYYQKMFHIMGYKKWIEQSGCYRKTLYEHFAIKSTSCNNCTNCRRLNSITQSAVQATTLISKEEARIKLVVCSLTNMLTKCLVCSHSQCNGIQCFPAKPSRCFCCHIGIVKATFHKSSECPADTSGKKISCFMSFSKYIPDRGSAEDHRNNRCLHKKRIKRILLYGVENAKDPGISARNLLVSALSNPTHWFAVMATNIETISRRKQTT
jgi:superfamily II DNA helicase RecQ